MAQFQRGSKKSLERNLGIMHGFVGTNNFDPIKVLTLDGGREAITDMVEECSDTEAAAEDIYRAMEEAGLHRNMQAVIDHVLEIALPDDLDSDWELSWGKCDNCDDYHGTLTNGKLGIEMTNVIDDFFDTLKICGTIFEAEDMTRHEAAHVLQQVAKKLSLDKEDSETAPAN